MIKKNVLTAVGIILSFIIAVGGWVVTSKLIDRESERLLSGTTSFLVDIPIVESTRWNEENDYPNVGVGLTEDEIVSILRNWELTDNRRLHEPAAGQLNMEQAIESGRNGLYFLIEQNILSAELLEFNDVRATLNQNIPHNGQFLPLRYSYWVVTFHNDIIEAFITVNAVTGQVWGIEITVNPRSAIMPVFEWRLNNDETKKMLAAFISDLQINSTQSPVTVWENSELLSTYASERNMSDTIIACQSFADGNAAAVIDAMGTFSLTPNGEPSFNKLKIFLTI